MRLALAWVPLLALERIEHVGPISYLVAFAGGLVSFLSPCVLPLVPGYLSMVTGLDIGTLEKDSRAHLAGIAATTGIFIAGFGTVFVLLGLSASAVGGALLDRQQAFTRISGALMLAMALFLAGSTFLHAPWLYQEKRFHPKFGRFGKAAPFVAGTAFGFGWSPCIGPVLGSILTIAADSGQAWSGATLLGVYTLGLGLPFLVTGLALGRLGGALSWVKRHSRVVVLGSAAVLAVFGVLLLLDQLSTLTREMQRNLDGTPFEWLVELG